jgi:rubrerythrin
MDFSDPFTGLTPPRKLTTEEIMRAIRIDIAAELDAINLYQAHIDAIDDERVNRVIAHIRDEEKEHVAEFTSLLN